MVGQGITDGGTVLQFCLGYLLKESDSLDNSNDIDFTVGFFGGDVANAGNLGEIELKLNIQAWHNGRVFIKSYLKFFGAVTFVPSGDFSI